MSNFLSIDEVVSFSLTTCKGATAEDHLLFRPWCVAACRMVGPNRDWYKVEAMYPKDFSFSKPSDLVRTCSIALFDSSHCELYYNFHTGSKRIHTNRHYNPIVNDGEGVIDLSEDANYYHLSSNATSVAYALIRYLSMPVDQEGFPLIPEDDLMAYEAFCAYMFAKRNKNSQSEIAQSYDIWLREMDRVKGRRKMPTPQEMEMIGSTWLSLINAPSFIKKY